MRYGYIAPYDFSDRMYDGGYDEVPYPKDFLKKNANFSENEYDGELPAWSLSALIELIPIKIRNSKQFTIYKGESGYSLTYFSHDEDYPIIRDGVTLLDTAFEMVCYLLENKLIK